jgi:hypothetical protein
VEEEEEAWEEAEAAEAAFEDRLALACARAAAAAAAGDDGWSKVYAPSLTSLNLSGFGHSGGPRALTSLNLSDAIRGHQRPSEAIRVGHGGGPRALTNLKLSPEMSPEMSPDGTSSGDRLPNKEGLPALLELTVGHCERLHTIRLRLPTLKRLFAPKCAALRTVVLETARDLEELHLSQCARLETIALIRDETIAQIRDGGVGGGGGGGGGGGSIKGDGLVGGGDGCSSGGGGGTALRTISLFGCRVLGHVELRELLTATQGSVRSLNINGALRTLDGL